MSTRRKCIEGNGYWTGEELTPKGLGYCSSGMKESEVRQGRDGRSYVTKRNARGALRWVLYKPEQQRPQPRAQPQPTRPPSIIPPPKLTQQFSETRPRSQFQKERELVLRKRQISKPSGIPSLYELYELAVEPVVLDPDGNEVRIPLKNFANGGELFDGIIEDLIGEDNRVRGPITYFPQQNLAVVLVQRYLTNPYSGYLREYEEEAFKTPHTPGIFDYVKELTVTEREKPWMADERKISLDNYHNLDIRPLFITQYELSPPSTIYLH